MGLLEVTDWMARKWVICRFLIYSLFLRGYLWLPKKVSNPTIICHIGPCLKLPSYATYCKISEISYLSVEQHRQIRLLQEPQSTCDPLRFRLFLGINFSVFQGMPLNCRPLSRRL